MGKLEELFPRVVFKSSFQGQSSSCSLGDTVKTFAAFLLSSHILQRVNISAFNSDVMQMGREIIVFVPLRGEGTKAFHGFPQKHGNKTLFYSLFYTQLNSKPAPFKYSFSFYMDSARLQNNQSGEY